MTVGCSPTERPNQSEAAQRLRRGVAKTVLIATPECGYAPSEIVGLAGTLPDTFLPRPNANRRAVLTLIPSSRSIVRHDSPSAAEDQLGQWRGYSHGSLGVSLAFDLKTFRPPPNIGTFVSFAPCVYDPVEKEKLVLHALHHFKEEVGGYRERVFKAACELNPEKLTSTDKEQVVKEFLEAHPSKKEPKEKFVAAVVNTRIDSMRIAALLKHSSFQEESEWRLVLPTLLDAPTPKKNPPQFRVEKTTLIPYVAYPFSAEPLPLVDIILGPGSDENSVFAAQRFLKSQDVNLTPRLSKVPYRAA
jgi:hypothetical protein